MSEIPPSISSCVVGRVVVQVKGDGRITCAPAQNIHWPPHLGLLLMGLLLAFAAGALLGWWAHER